MFLCAKMFLTTKMLKNIFYLGIRIMSESRYMNLFLENIYVRKCIQNISDKSLFKIVQSNIIITLINITLTLIEINILPVNSYLKY